MTSGGTSLPGPGATKPQARSGERADGAGSSDVEPAAEVIANATDIALGAVLDAKRQVDVLRIRRNAIQDQQSTGYRRRSANLPHLGDRAQSVAAEMAALRPSRPS